MKDRNTAKDKATALTVEHLPEGGYLVADGHRQQYELATVRAAFTTLDEALGYMKVTMVPDYAEPPPSADLKSA